MEAVVSSDTQHFETERALDWRARRVEEILATRSHKRSDDDTIIRHYLEYRRGLQGAETRKEHLEAFAHCWGAERIHHPSNYVLATLVEARILAGATDDEIASYAGTIPLAIASYEQLFFDVRDRLANRVWIMSQVLLRGGDGEKPPGSAHEQFRLQVCSAAYFGGTSAMDEDLPSLAFALLGVRWINRPAIIGKRGQRRLARGRRTKA